MMVNSDKLISFLILIYLGSPVRSAGQTDASGYPVLEIGTQSSNIFGKDSSGVIHSLHSVESKNILLFFYETSCHFCEAILPEMKEKYPEWKKKGYEIYALPLNKDFEGWQAQIREQKSDWINVTDTVNTEQIRQAYKITVTPTIYVLDDKRKIASTRLVRPEAIDEWISLHSENIIQKK